MTKKTLERRMIKYGYSLPEVQKFIEWIKEEESKQKQIAQRYIST